MKVLCLFAGSVFLFLSVSSQAGAQLSVASQGQAGQPRPSETSVTAAEIVLTFVESIPAAAVLIEPTIAAPVISEVQIQFVNAEGKTVDAEGRPIQARTSKEFLLRELRVKPGQSLQESDIQQDIRQLRRLGLFDRIVVNRQIEGDRVILTYELLEAAADSFSPSGGYDEVSGIYGSLTYTNRAVGEVGQQLSLTLQIGERDIQYNGSYTRPYLMSDPDMPGYRMEGFNRTGFSSVFDDRIRLPNGDRVQENRIGGGIVFNRPIGDWESFFGLNYTRYRLRDGSDRVFATDARNNPLTWSGTGIDDLTTVLLALQLDQRNNVTNPTDGTFVRFSSEQSLPIGLGNIVSNRLQATYSQYIPVGLLAAADRPAVFAYNLQLGTTLGDLPPYRAFSLGGPESVRGYDYNQVGSGRSYALATIEYRIPFFYFPFSTWPMTAVIFTDFASDLGSGSAVPGEPAIIRGKPGSGFGYGTGLRVDSALGILRLDLGWNDRGESRVHFGFGQRF